MAPGASAKSWLALVLQYHDIGCVNDCVDFHQQVLRYTRVCRKLGLANITHYVPSKYSMGHRSSLSDPISGLDGLRALACLAVFGVHFQQTASLKGNIGPFDLARLLENGNTGVALFFILSGFLLSIPFWNSLERAEPAPRWRTFWLKRAARILPAYFLCLTLLVVHNRLWEQTGESTNILLHYVLLFNYSPQHIFSINPPFWTLAVEVQFYALLPLIFLVIAAFPRAFRVPAVIGLAVLAYVAQVWVIQCEPCRGWWPWNGQNDVAQNPVITYSLLAHLPHFLLGVLGGGGHSVLKAARRQHFFAVQGGAEGVAWIAAALVFVILATPLDTRLSIPFGRYNLPFVPVLLTLIVLSVGHTVLIKALLELAPMRWIGQVSYGVYIYHLPILNVVGRYMRNAGLEVKEHWLILLVTALTITLVVAAFSYYLVERPIFRRIRRHMGA